MIGERQDFGAKRIKTLMRDVRMGEKLFSEIAAKDITAKAERNHAAFYLHYNDMFGVWNELGNQAAVDFAKML